MHHYIYVRGLILEEFKSFKAYLRQLKGTNEYKKLREEICNYNKKKKKRTIVLPYDFLNIICSNWIPSLKDGMLSHISLDYKRIFDELKLYYSIEGKDLGVYKEKCDDKISSLHDARIYKNRLASGNYKEDENTEIVDDGEAVIIVELLRLSWDVICNYFNPSKYGFPEVDLIVKYMNQFSGKIKLEIPEIKAFLTIDYAGILINMQKNFYSNLALKYEQRIRELERESDNKGGRGLKSSELESLKERSEVTDEKIKMIPNEEDTFWQCYSELERILSMNPAIYIKIEPGTVPQKIVDGSKKIIDDVNKEYYGHFLKIEKRYNENFSEELFNLRYKYDRKFYENNDYILFVKKLVSLRLKGYTYEQIMYEDGFMRLMKNVRKYKIKTNDPKDKKNNDEYNVSRINAIFNQVISCADLEYEVSQELGKGN